MQLGGIDYSLSKTTYECLVTSIARLLVIAVAIMMCTEWCTDNIFHGLQAQAWPQYLIPGCTQFAELLLWKLATSKIHTKKHFYNQISVDQNLAGLI